MAKFSSTIKLHGISAQVSGTYETGLPATRWHPGDPDECAVDTVTIGGVNINNLIDACNLWQLVQEAATQAVFCC